MAFALGSNEDLGTVIDTVNYLTANLGQSNVLTVNTQTGQVSSPLSATVVSYLYQWIEVRYADGSAGQGISTSPTNKKYYGLRNTTTPLIVDQNPADYVWYEVAGTGFGTNKFLYYQTIGGRAITWFVGTVPPNNTYLQVQDTVPVNLDVLTSVTNSSIVTQSAFIRDTVAPDTPTGGSFNFDTLVLTPPSGWSATTPSGTDQLWTSQNIFLSPDSGNSSPPSQAWSTPVQISQPGTNGTSTVIGYARIPNNPVPTSGTITTTGATYPTSAESTVTWALTTSWSNQDPNPSSSASLYQTNGSFNPQTEQTIWSTPFISSLQATSLASISDNLGTVVTGTVGGNITVSTTSYVATPLVEIGAWGILVSPTNGGLLFKYNGANLMVLNTDGHLITSGNVTPNGTVN